MFWFLKNWQIPVVQLNPEDTIICLAHNQNTIKKDSFFKEENKVNSLVKYGLDPNISEILKKIKKNLYK